MLKKIVLFLILTLVISLNNISLAVITIEDYNKSVIKKSNDICASK
jgi:hypothetical protein